MCAWPGRLSTVVVERMLDLASVVLMFVVFAQFIPMPPVFAQAAFIGGAIVVALLAAFGLMIWQSARVERLLTALSRRIPKLPTEMLLHWFRDIRDGFRLIGTPRKLALVALTTVGVWATNLFVSYFTMAAFMPASLDQAGLVMVMANLGGALPSAPGGIGVVQGFARESLVIPFGIDKNVAVAFAFVWSLWQQLALIVLGLFSLAQVGLSFAKVARGSQQASRVTPDNASLTGSPAAQSEPGD